MFELHEIKFESLNLPDEICSDNGAGMCGMGCDSSF